MRVLMVTPYPPNRDGIAAYAVQAVRALRTQGHQVEVLSPGPSAAHHYLDLVGPRGALALARRVRAFDRVVVQFHPDVFYPLAASPRQRIAEGLALTVVFRLARSVEVVVHEIDRRHGRRSTLHGQVTRMMWRSVDLVRVHTERDADAFSRNFGVPRSRIVVTDHGANFVPRTGYDRAGARASLGVPEDAFVYLSIGFIQPHKGFDRAVRAFAELGVPNARLDVVGSVRVEEPDFVAYRDELAALVAATDGAHLHDGFVSDELFDRWIVACDTVVLPYRSIWSSGVLERARLFGRPVIATAVGGLPEQAAALAAGRPDGHGAPGVVLVSGEEELRRAMRAAAGADPSGVSRPWPKPGAGLRARVQDEVVMRAAAYRGARRPADPLALRPGGPGGSGSSGGPPASAVSAALRRMRSLDLPPATSDRPLVRLVKRVVRRLTAWEVEPVVRQLNTLRTAAVEAVEAAHAQRAATPAAVPAGATAGATAGVADEPAVEPADRTGGGAAGAGRSAATPGQVSATLPGGQDVRGPGRGS